MFKSRLQSIYNNQAEFESYDENFNITERLGYTDSVKLWNDNPIIKGGVNPSEYAIVNEVYRLTGTRRILGSIGTSEKFSEIYYNAANNDTPKESMTRVRCMMSVNYDMILFTKVEKRGVNGHWYNVPMMQALELE